LPEYGNEITFLNTSSIPMTIPSYELVWTSPHRWIGVKIPFTHEVISDDTPFNPAFDYNIPIEPHATHTLSFADQHHFEWGLYIPETVYLRILFLRQITSASSVLLSISAFHQQATQIVRVTRSAVFLDRSIMEPGELELGERLPAWRGP
jgi:hypothetical protein